MIRCKSWILMIALSTVGTTGCTSLFTKRAIERFSESMKSQNLDGLKVASSEDFEHKALRQADSAKGLKMLKIPTGKVEIVSVEKLEDGKRRVMVKVGEKDKQKDVEYLLTQGPKGWVVDDVILKQDTGGGKMAERSVTEQMDLLLTSREMLIAWREGDREQKLSFCTEKLQNELKPLPPAWFECLAKEIAGPGHQSTFKPDARLNGDKAFLVVPHPQGSLYLEMHRVGEEWKVGDLAIEPSSKESTGIRSLAKVIEALNKSAEFLNAYQEKNQPQLSKSSSKNFYNQCLVGADLDEVPLPVGHLLKEKYEARQFTDGGDAIKRVEMLFQNDNHTYMLTLRLEDPVNENGQKGQTEFRVDEVTMFEKGDKDVRRMSSVYLTNASVDFYVAALRNRDIKALRSLSSSNFCDKVWNRPESSYFAIMPDPELPADEPEVITTNFHGDVAEVTLVVGQQPMTLILHTAQGRMVVDDVQMPALDRPNSLKENLEILLTVQAFNSALHRKDLSALVKYSAEGLDRIAWRQLNELPPMTDQFLRPLMGQVQLVQISDQVNIVKTTDGNLQAELRLVRESDQYVVSDVSLSVPKDPEHRLEMMAMLRQMIADGTIGPAAQRRIATQQAAAEAIKAEDAPQRSTFEPIEPAVYTR